MSLVRPVVLSLGTNLGDKEQHMRSMVAGARGFLVEPVRVSDLMETEPLGMTPDAPWFLNCLIAGGFDGTARELLGRCHAVEQSLGRTRNGKWESRTADVDILLFGDEQIADDDLVVPHPQIRSRRFCLEGLRQLVPDMVIPGVSMTMHELYERMDSGVRRQNMRVLGTNDCGRGAT
ncbi:MAG: 2-amino-4-hydroxy-6-hydroxymethyldihydropteridine diphosphokinase [Chitinivibrionales bacterium]|nr:2-amino-4-hydroxy-6-hydroxymethyldihydropteridine diphosphokinase [Chitinivibrionales bacterium]